ncbi:MAG: hypothetical protein HYY52_02135 [Candidatus Melainabacteria bacterium]|nr:hypothetical protein [Candidatus Melainabacteria bacterium]
MNNKQSENNLKDIRTKIDELKERLNNIDRNLNLQEKILDELNQDSKSLFQNTPLTHKSTNSMEDIIRGAFAKRRIPKIFFK